MHVHSLIQIKLVESIKMAMPAAAADACVRMARVL
jgi:hypothetical protein